MFLNIMFQNTYGKISVEIKIVYTSRLHRRSIQYNWLKLILVGFSLTK